jgi:hypothetical protein
MKKHSRTISKWFRITLGLAKSASLKRLELILAGVDQDFAGRTGEQQWLLIRLATASSHATKPK